MADGYRTVDRDVYNRTQNQARQARQRMATAERNLHEAEARLRQAEEDLRTRSRFDANQLQREIKEQGRILTNELDSIEESIRLELGRQNVHLRKQLDEVRANVNASNRSVDELNRRINQLSEDFNANVRIITERIAKQQERAQYYLNQLDIILGIIDALHPDKLTPGRADQLHEGRDFIAADIARGDYEAAIGLAQNELIDAVSLQSELEALNDEFNRLVVDISREIMSIESRIDSLYDNNANARNVNYGRGLYELQYTYNGDIDYWSNGLSVLLCNRFDEEETRINQEFIADMDLENLRTALHSLPLYSTRFNNCETFAIEEFLISCGIQNLAIRINDALTNDVSWVLEESGFENDDFRRSYAFTFRDGLHNIVSIVIVPNRINGNNGEIQFFVQAFDGEKTTSPADCAVIRNAVVARLHSAGIDIGERNRESQYRQSVAPSEFISSTYVEGAEIKDGRINMVRQRLNL